MPPKIAPSALKAQERTALLQGHTQANKGEKWLSTLGQLATERMLQEAWEREQAEVLGRGRYERRLSGRGYRKGSEDGPRKTAEGVLRVPVPQVWGLADPYRSQSWTTLAKTRAPLKRRIVEMFVGGMSQRDLEAAWESALGQFVLSKSSVRALTATLSQAYAAFRPRDWGGDDVAYRLMDTVDAPLRRWGSKPGVRCVWGICVDGRKVFLTLATTPSESAASGLEGLRDLSTRGLQTPVTSTPEGAPGLIKASDAMWPRARRLRGGFHKRPHWEQTVPPQAWPACKALGADRRAAPTVEEGQRRCERRGAASQGTCPEACRCLADDTAASWPPRQVPLRHRQYGRPSHLAERAFEEERRRTNVIPPLWDDASWVTLVFAVLIRVSERWGKKQESEFEQHHIRALRQWWELDQPLETPSLVTMAAQPRRSAASAR